MSFRSFFGFGKGSKSQSQYKRTTLRMEALEERALLSAVPLSASEYANLRGQYAEFNLPTNMANLNVITLDLAEGDGLSQLKSAISTAGTTTKSDLIVVRTSDAANSIVYQRESDEIAIEISQQYGSVTIVGWGSELLTLNANQNCRGMNITGEHTSVNLGNIKIQYGYADGSGGGGINNQDGTLALDNCVITENSSYMGGGISNVNGNLTVLNSQITFNSSVWGGGGIDNDISDGSSKNLTVSNSTISHNSTMFGGGIFNRTYEGSAYVTIFKSEISNNTAEMQGGGIYNRSYNEDYNVASVTIDASIISGNTANDSGGGICNYKDCGMAYLTVTNSLISQNTATGSFNFTNPGTGGGISNLWGKTLIINSTIADNIAATAGGGFYQSDSDYDNEIYNSIIVRNSFSGVDDDDIFVESKYDDYPNNIIGYNNLTTFREWTEGANNVIFDPSLPLFVEGSNDRYRLTIRSQAINKGDNQYIVNYNTDLGGSARIVDGTVDIGAYEYQNDFVYSSVVDTLNDSFDLYDDEWSLREAIYYAPGYVDITFREDLEGQIILSEQLEITQALSINGDDRIVVSGNQSNRVFSVSAGTVQQPVILDGLMIAFGNAGEENGGGIYIREGALTVSNSYIMGNEAFYGGGISATGDVLELVISNCEISENSSSYGGGICTFYADSLKISDSEIKNNCVEVAGGGISIYSYDDASGAVITNSKIYNNFTTDEGFCAGGIYHDGTKLTISHSEIFNNSVQGGNGSGGGIASFGPLTLDNSAVYDNSASGNGGGIEIVGTITVKNCTIAGNTSGDFGGGIYQSAMYTDIEGFYYNTIIAGNTWGDVNDDIYLFSDHGSNTINGYNNLTSYTEWTNGANNVVFDPSAPLFADASNGDYRLVIRSQAINKGDNLYVDVTTDLAGDARISGANVDIGAYEYQLSPQEYSTVVDTLNDSFDLYDDEWSLREAIYYAPGYVDITFREDLEGAITLENGQLEITQALSISGENRIAVNGNQNNRVFSVSAGTVQQPVILDGLTILFGYADEENGGGIYLSEGALTVSNSYIMGNEAFYGGGIYATGDALELVISNCEISENSSSYGGGICTFYADSLKVSHSEIDNNFSRVAGGGISIYFDDDASGAVISNSKIYNNSISDEGAYGGGIYHYGGKLTISHSAINNNSVYNGAGGGILSVGSLSLSNSVVYDNYAAEHGGGIEITGSITVKNSTIAGNRAGDFGGGICQNSYSFINTEGNYYNSIIACNMALQANDMVILIESGSNTINGYNNLTPFTGWTNGANNVVFDPSAPLFAKGASDGYRLANGSQAIDQGNNEFVDASTDLIGNARISGAHVDIGAYEYTSPMFCVEVAGPHSVVVTVIELENASGYILDYSTSADFANATSLEVSAGSTSITDLSADTTYYFRLKAIYETGYSDYSDTVTVTTPSDSLKVRNDFVKTTLNNSVVIDYRANDTVPDWSTSTVRFGDATYGKFAVNADGTVTYTPENGFYGTDAVSYIVIDKFGNMATASMVINVGLPIAASVQTTSDIHTPSSPMAASVASLTDWDDCYVELWAQDVSELNPGETTFTLEYNPAVYAAPAFSACADGVTLTVFQSSVLPNGNVQVELTALVSDTLVSQTDNLFLGTVVLTPSMAEGSGVDGSAVPVIALDGFETPTTVESMSYDLIRNGAVDASDFVAFATVFGYIPDSLSPENPLYAQAAKADFNNDGKIDVDDFILFATNFGAKKTTVMPTAQPGASVPQIVSEVVENENVVIQIAESDSSEQISSDLQPVTYNLQLINESRVESSMTLRQAHSSALLDLYDNQSEPVAVGKLSASAIDEALYQDDEFDFLFDGTDSDASDNSDVDLTVVLDELELELI